MDGWLDEGTRAVSLELPLHSSSGRKFVYARILVELPAEGGMPVTHESYITFNTFNTFSTLKKTRLGMYDTEYWSGLGEDGGGIMGDRCVARVREHDTFGLSIYVPPTLQTLKPTPDPFRRSVVAWSPLPGGTRQARTNTA